MAWGIGFIVVGGLIVLVGVQLANRTETSRYLAVAAEVALALFVLIGNLNIVTDAVPLLLVIATLVALYWPDSQAAFAGTATATTVPPATAPPATTTIATPPPAEPTASDTPSETP